LRRCTQKLRGLRRWDVGDIITADNDVRTLRVVLPSFRHHPREIWKYDAWAAPSSVEIGAMVTKRAFYCAM
jgi:hypothetical protein